MNKDKIKALFPEEVETITMTKEDYDRNIEQLLVEKLELEHKYNLMKKNAYQLAMKIDKAIKYIENTKFDLSDDEYDLREYDGKKLLEILKGESNE